jgi:sulfur carrier protein
LPANSVELVQSGKVMPQQRGCPVTDATTLARTITVNGEAVSTQVGTLAELVAELGHAGRRIATARNGDFVPERARSATRIEGGDRIEIVSPRHGG